NSCSERELRLLNMILVVILSPSVSSGKTVKEFDTVEQAVKRVLEYPALVDELVQVAELLEERRSHIPIAMEDSPQIPLKIHCRYSRDEVLSAYGYTSVSNVKSMREGVLWIPKENTDVLFVTLNKSAQDFSDTTMYKDYAISEWLFHWESQSTTSVSSKTGQRYLNHASNGTRIALFIRREKRDLSGRTLPFFFAGHVTYVKHESDRPVAITWKLEHPLPGDLVHLLRTAIA
ncbi:MAG: DUF3427 domain-containing protein, partial [Anaerolineae bacterium]|nr:DUF3427 domain-containing protein [Anaerolineae bacterium]